MIILGIHDGTNPSAALVRNGRLLGVGLESRHRRSLQVVGFPRRAALRLLADNGVAPRDVDVVAFAGHSMKTPQTLRDYLSRYTDESAIGGYARTAISYVIPGAFRTDQRKRERLANLARSGIETSRGTFVDGHLAAAMQAYVSGSTFPRRCLILCVNSGSDRIGATVHVGQNGKLERIASVLEEDSLGNVLEHVTYMLGMVPQRDEELLMELGARASGPGVLSAAKRFQLLFGFDEHLPLNWQRASNMPETGRCQEFLRKHFRRRRFDHIAGGWSRFLSRFIAEWIGRCAHKTEIRDLVVTGDLFELGSLLPTASRERGVISLNTGVLPGAAGNSVGAAMLVAAEREPAGAKSLEPVSTPYLGAEASRDVIAKVVSGINAGPDLVIERPEDLPRRVASLLAAGAVLARFAGREDVRMRGLGNRSVLGRADHPMVKEKLHEVAHTDCFWTSSPLLWQSERLRASFLEADTLPEAPCGEFWLTPRHASPWLGIQKGIAIPVQAISRRTNPHFWALLDAAGLVLGRTPLVTEPWKAPDGHIVRTPAQAAQLWMDHGLSGVVLGEWLIYRPDLSVRPAMAAGARTYLGPSELD